MLEVFHRYQLVILSKKYGAVKIVYFPFKINFHLFFFFFLLSLLLEEVALSEILNTDVM